MAALEKGIRKSESIDSATLWLLFDAWMPSGDDLEVEKSCQTTLGIALEYVEADETFNFYIRKVSNCPLAPSLIPRCSRAVMYIVKGISRRTWTGRRRIILPEEIEGQLFEKFSTLSVERCSTTLFNEYFSCTVKKADFHYTMLRIQFCDVDKDDNDVVVGELDYWIDTNPIVQFTHFDILLPSYMPDLGEVELSLVYLPTMQRIVVNSCATTNLKLDPKCQKIHVRVVMFLDARSIEAHRTEQKDRCEQATKEEGLSFCKKLVFDVDRRHLPRTSLLVHVVQTVAVDDVSKLKKRVIGKVVVSSSGSEWKKMLEVPRSSVAQIYRLSPSAG